MPGQAEVEQDHVGVAVGGPVQPLLAGPGHHHLVALGAQADGQGPQQGGVVVAHQHLGTGLARCPPGWGRACRAHGPGPARGCRLPGRSPREPEPRAGPGESGSCGAASGIRTTMVQPPPGVSSTSSSPPTASTNPRATARPRPTPTPVVGVPEALERSEDPVAVLGPDPRTPVDDPDVHPAGHRTGLDPEAAAPAVDQGVVDQVGHGPFEEHRIGADAGERGFDVHGHLPPRGPRLPTAASISSATSVL